MKKKYARDPRPAMLIAPEGWEHQHDGFVLHEGQLLPRYIFVGEGTREELQEALRTQALPTGPGPTSWYDPKRDGPGGKARIVAAPAIVECPHCGIDNVIDPARGRYGHDA